MRAMRRRVFLLSVSAAALAGCTNDAPKIPDATPDRVANAVYRHDGPPEVVLYTMISNDSGSGAHTSMMINASQRVIWDPAGSFRNEKIVERGDVVFGVTPPMEDVYRRFHARKTFHVVVQRMALTPEVAEGLLQRALVAGNQQPANCAASTARLMNATPGFPKVPQTYFPKTLAEAFGALPGVTTRRFYETDDPDRFKALAALIPALEAF
jgi:hypothetical protein